MEILSSPELVSGLERLQWIAGNSSKKDAETNSV